MNEIGSNLPNTKSSSKRFLEIIIVAIIYYLTARLGQLLAIPPGNITPVWIPSGILLAAVLIRGYYIWPGIFLGAFLGNIWAYIDTNSLLNISKCLFTGTANGIGDVLSAVGGAYLIVRTTGSKNPFNKSADTVKFIAYGAIIGPAVSAILGVTSLCIVGFVSWDTYLFTSITWWTGDGVGALLIAPVIILCTDKGRRDFPSDRLFELAFFSVVLLGIGFYCIFYLPVQTLIRLPLFTITPVLIWSAFRFGQTVTFSSVLSISCVFIIATAMGQGPFSYKEISVSLMNLQWFILVISITIFVLSCLIEERKYYNEVLKKSHNNLERRIEERTIKLQQEITERKQTEEALRQYEHIVSSSTDMLALLDKRFNYIAVNKVYVEAFKLIPEQLIGNTIADVFGEDFFNTVIKPNADRCLGGEETNYRPRKK